MSTACLTLLLSVAGAVFFVHGRDDAVGTTVLKFTLTDSHDNALIDQTFVISIIGEQPVSFL